MSDKSNGSSPQDQTRLTTDLQSRKVPPIHKEQETDRGDDSDTQGSQDLPTLPPEVEDLHSEEPAQAESTDLPPVPLSDWNDPGTVSMAGGPTPSPDGADSHSVLRPEIPGYEILAELGRGGMGVVYQARHVQLDRIVALKMILGGEHAGGHALARFRTEAEAVARLQHPNIVQIHDVGEHQGLPYFSLEFCPGGSLDKQIKGNPTSSEEAVALVEKLAGAMQVAHESYVIHRDLKPANVLLTADGTPKITDFGLAKKLDEAGQTQTGAILGTPSYMAPELASERKLPISPATDVYALGAILYELLTGRPPFLAATGVETIFQVLSNDPVPPRQLQPRLSRDLNTICMKCLQKEPTKRYASAAQLAEDLHRWEVGEPIHARPVGQIERSVKWIKRHPVISFLTAAVILVLISGLVGIGWAYRIALANEKTASRYAHAAKANADTARTSEEQAKKDRDKAQEQEQIARQREREALEQLANGSMMVAQSAFEDSNLQRARDWLEKVPTQPYQLRRWEWSYLKRKLDGGLFTLYGHTGGVASVAWSPDGSLIATGSADRAIRLWNASTGQLVHVLRGHRQPVTSVQFSSDGRRLITAGDREPRVWDVQSGNLLLKLSRHSMDVHTARLSPGGTRLATVCNDDTLTLWSTRTRKPLFQKPGRANKRQLSVPTLAFSPDGLRLAMIGAGFGSGLRVLSTTTGESVFSVGGASAWTIAYSPDGSRIATADYSVI